MTNHPLPARSVRASKRSPDDLVRISQYQTAELWTIPKRGDLAPHVVSFHCPSCRDPENSRLVHVVLETGTEETESLPARLRKNPTVRILVHMTRPQVEEILASFGRHDNRDTLMDILHHKGEEPNPENSSPKPSSHALGRNGGASNG